MIRSPEISEMGPLDDFPLVSTVTLAPIPLTLVFANCVKVLYVQVIHVVMCFLYLFAVRFLSVP
jgi:hypothetical protein